jgi:hypothetical protein
MLVISRGMGDTAATSSPGEINACGVSYLSYLTTPFCWGDSSSNWANAYANQSTLTSFLGTGNSALGGSDACTQVTGIGCPIWAVIGVAVVLLVAR